MNDAVRKKSVDGDRQSKSGTQCKPSVSAPVGETVGESGSKDSQCRRAKKIRRVVNYKKLVHQEASAAFPAIVGKLITKAKAGSIYHTKYLFEVAGITEHFSAPTVKRRASRSLGKLLIAEVKKLEDAGKVVEADAGVADDVPRKSGEAAKSEG